MSMMNATSVRNCPQPTRTLEISLITETTHPICFAPNSMYFRFQVKPLRMLHLVRGDRDSGANLMPIYGDLYQIKL